MSFPVAGLPANSLTCRPTKSASSARPLAVNEQTFHLRMGIEGLLVQIPDQACNLVAAVRLLVGAHQRQAGVRGKELLIPATRDKRLQIGSHCFPARFNCGHGVLPCEPTM